MSAETVEEVIVPEPEVVPAEPPARHREESADDPAEQGTPAGQVALGAISVLAVGGAGLYSATGVAGLVVGGAATVAAGGGYAYHRFRRTHPHKGSGRHGSAPRSTGASRTGSAKNPLSGLTSRSGRRAAFSTGGSSGGGARKAAGGGRSGLRMPSLGGGGRAGGKAGGKRMSFSGGKSAGGGRSGKGGRATKGGLSGKGGGGKGGGKGRSRAGGGITSAAHKVGGAGRKFGRMAGKSARGARTAGSRTAGAARTVAGKSRRAGSWINHKTGGRAGRAFSYPGRAGLRAGKAAGRGIAKHARRAGGWVDRRTGRRVSTAWRAMRGAEGFRASRRRGAAVLGGWDAQVTASLLALVALLAEQWKRAKARKEAKVAEAGSTATAETPEAATPEVETPESVVHGGDPPITTTVTCPRCGATHTVTIPGGHSERIVNCECGYRIRFFRIPDGPFNETAETQHASRPTGRATQRGPGMSGMITHATELPTIASSYETEDMMQVKGDLEMLRELPLQVAAAIRLMTERLSADYPIHNDVVEGLHVVYEGFAQLANVCDEVSNTFQAAHEADIARRLEPRTNEQKWNHQ